MLLCQTVAGIALYTATRAAVLDDAKAHLIDIVDQAIHQLGTARNLSATLPRGAGVVVADGNRGWTVAAGDISQAVTVLLPAPGEGMPRHAEVVEAGGEELVLQAALLPGRPDQPPAAVVAVSSLSDGLRSYRYVWIAVAGGLVLLLVAAWLSARLIDRLVQRPIDQLAVRIARIGQGNYVLPDTQPGDDIGRRLSVALTNMTQAIADREYRIREMVLHEPVTHLPNRAAFLEEIAPQLGAERAAVLMIGLVHAQEIANTVNRDVSDRVLRNAATRLGRLLGNVPLACLSDRTFAVFLRNVGELRARTIAARIVSQFESPYSDNTLTIDTAAAVGIALMPAHGDEGALLLRRAEVALQTGLRAEHRWAVYDHAADPHRPDRLSLMSDLRQGLGRGEFMLVYQPKLHLPSGRVTGAEALIRWHHPQRGLVPTGEFITLAEDTGNIGHLTRWALRAGIEQTARWHAEGIDLQISINVSARDLSDARLPKRVMQLLEDHRLGPEAIALEVTESTIMTNPTMAIAVLRRLAEGNIAVAVDDFGVGRASLAYLRTLPVRELKIDRTFVQRLVEDPDDRKIVRSVVELGHSLGFAVSVEGVEDAATLAVVAELGCDYVQGYFVSRPLVPEMLVRFVQQQPPVVTA
ncbi:MAG: bifunctional diguanylate cyclase/phosphodiesterase [Acetobacteraceae bacterium]